MSLNPPKMAKNTGKGSVIIFFDREKRLERDKIQQILFQFSLTTPSLTLSGPWTP